MKNKIKPIFAYECHKCRVRHTTENMVAFCASCYSKHGEESVTHFKNTLTKEDRQSLAAVFGFEAGEANAKARLEIEISEAHKRENNVNALNIRLIEERDEALAKWHAHQKWKSWEKSHPQWDVDECRECGHISQAHFQAFIGFIRSRILVDAFNRAAEWVDTHPRRWRANLTQDFKDWAIKEMTKDKSLEKKEI